jgi:glycosyltransferase involved in cell wall biosynthesis
VIIPSRNERFLPQTVNDIFAKAAGDLEVIIVLDGYWPVDEANQFLLADRPNLIIIHHSVAQGMRAAINSAAAIAKGQYLLKCDAHCMFGEGFDEILTSECEDNWIVIPRRLSLDAEKWEPRMKEPIDSEYLFYPYEHPDDLGLHARPWYERGRQRKDILIDEDVSFQGSCWLMTNDHFHKRLGGVSEVGYETFMGEPQEIGFKTQLGPWKGAIMRNKKTWYAHLHKGKQWGRMYYMSSAERYRGNAYSFDFWWNDRWDERARDLDWLIEHFWPMPGWPDDWRKNYWKKT